MGSTLSQQRLSHITVYKEGKIQLNLIFIFHQEKIKLKLTLSSANTLQAYMGPRNDSLATSIPEALLSGLGNQLGKLTI